MTWLAQTRDFVRVGARASRPQNSTNAGGTPALPLASSSCPKKLRVGKVALTRTTDRL